MKKLFAALCAVVCMVAFSVTPAAAFVSSSHRVIGTGNCTVDIGINNYNNQTPGATPLAGGTGWIQVANNNCAYMGVKYRIRKCDGTYSTSAEEGMFNPRDFFVIERPYGFNCTTVGGVVGIYVRAASNGGSWTPPQSPAPSYIYHSYTGSCTPNYCI